MKGLFWSSFQKKLVSFDEWMTEAETNIGDLEMYGKKKMMGGGYNKKKKGMMGGGRMEYGHGGGVSGNAAARREGKAMGGAMKTSKPC